MFRRASIMYIVITRYATDTTIPVYKCTSIKDALKTLIKVAEAQKRTLFRFGIIYIYTYYSSDVVVIKQLLLSHLGTPIYYFIFLFIIHVHNDKLNTFKRQPCLRFASMERKTAEMWNFLRGA